MKISLFETADGLDLNCIQSGVYKFLIGPADCDPKSYLTLYVGESYSMLARCGDHIYSLYQDPSYMGLTQSMLADTNLRLIVKVHEIVFIPSEMSYTERDIVLRAHELEAIKQLKPICQKESNDNVRDDRVDHVKEILNKTFNLTF